MLGEPNCPAVSVLGAREGLQARARREAEGGDQAETLGTDRTRSNSSGNSGLHVTLGSGPACSFSPSPDSHFASFSRPSTPHACPTLRPPNTMNHNNTTRLLKGVTYRPTPSLRDARSVERNEVRQGRVAPPELTATAVHNAQRAAVPTGCGPNGDTTNLPAASRGS